MGRGGGGHLREQLLLDLEVLDHRLEHPVGVLELGPVVLEVAGTDETHVLGQVERGRLELLEARDGLSGENAAILALAEPLWNDVEEDDVDPRGDQVGGHLRPHRPGPEDHCLPNVLFHGSTSISTGRLE